MLLILARTRRNKKIAKAKRDKQQKTLNIVDSINHAESSVNKPAQSMVRSKAGQNQVVRSENVPTQKSEPKQKIKIIDQDFLPRQNAESEKVIKAINEVNKRISKSVEDTSEVKNIFFAFLF